MKKTKTNNKAKNDYSSSNSSQRAQRKIKKLKGKRPLISQCEQTKKTPQENNPKESMSQKGQNSSLGSQDNPQKSKYSSSKDKNSSISEASRQQKISNGEASSELASNNKNPSADRKSYLNVRFQRNWYDKPILSPAMLFLNTREVVKTRPRRVQIILVPAKIKNTSVHSCIEASFVFAGFSILKLRKQVYENRLLNDLDWEYLVVVEKHSFRSLCHSLEKKFHEKGTLYVSPSSKKNKLQLELEFETRKDFDISRTIYLSNMMDFIDSSDKTFEEIASIEFGKKGVGRVWFMENLEKLRNFYNLKKETKPGNEK